ncbi:hypothetical protein Adt_24058 [Abeliophyllum distichum]|uniref:Uncharacterized protein n=1 Tax=Abeliophyllum distichum TaxID=126358 RepID=A0ABD1SDN8_9LAMI
MHALPKISSLNNPRSKASPTGARPSISLFHKEQASVQCLSHWNSAINQFIPQGTSLSPVPLPLGLGHQSACSIQRNKPRSSASPTGTRQSRLVPSKETSLAQVPPPLGLGNRPTCSIQRNEPRSIVFPAHQAQIKARSPHKCPP